MVASGTGSGAFQTVRFYAEGDTTDTFAEVQDVATSKPMANNGQVPGTIEIKNTGANPLYFSHDGGTSIHGKVLANETKLFREKRENTVAVKSANSGQATHYLVHAW